jgi:AraC-like DNA-binding protein
VGFGDTSRFARMFRVRFGVSPIGMADAARHRRATHRLS